MAVLGKFDDAFVEINSVDLSAFVRSVTLETSASEEDISAMGDNWSEFTLGRQEWSGSVDLWQSFYTAEVDATLNGLLNGTAVTIKIRPTSSAATTVNPEYTGSVFVTAYSPAAGSFDENLSTSFSFRGTGTLTRSTS